MWKLGCLTERGRVAGGDDLPRLVDAIIQAAGDRHRSCDNLGEVPRREDNDDSDEENLNEQTKIRGRQGVAGGGAQAPEAGRPPSTPPRSRRLHRISRWGE